MTLNKKSSEVKDHATYSASGASRWLNCPGSIRLSEKAPEQRESEYAAEGTQAHACLELLLRNMMNPTAAEKSARRHFPAEMVDHALVAVEWVHGRLENGQELLVETKVDSSAFTCAEQFGTLDIAIAEEFGRLVIADFKYGAGIGVDPVDSSGEANAQLVYYALALSHLYNHNFSEVELVVIQPRAYHDSGETVRSHVMRMDELFAWNAKFLAGVKACEKADAPLASGSWCRFCPAAVICPELKTKALKTAQVVFSDTTGVESVPEPKLIQLPNLGVALNACDRLEDWISKVREHAVHVLERGEQVDGYKLVAKRGIRKWVNEDKSFKEASKRFGELAFTSPKLLSPAQLEKATKGVPGVEEWVATRTSAESSGTTLARETDKRPAVKPIEKVFALPPVGETWPAAVPERVVRGRRKK